MFLESEDDRNHRVAQQPPLVQTLPAAVNSFTSSKKTLCSLPKNPPLPLARSSHRTFSGICCCEPSQNSEQRGSASRNYDLLTLRTPAGGRFYARSRARAAHTCSPLHTHVTWQHASDPHIEKTERSHWCGGGGRLDRRDSFLRAVHQWVQAAR